ncbi:MAG: hypothetical protein H5T62_04110 [Anaerolineae bacterium]|nr:hypothetical protein [Anaerolineae bacterium]
MRFPQHRALTRLGTKGRSSLVLCLIACLTALLVWSGSWSLAPRADQSPLPTAESPLPPPEPSPAITVPATPPAAEPPVEGPASPLARLLLWIGIGLLVVAAVVGLVLLVQRLRGIG